MSTGTAAFWGWLLVVASVAATTTRSQIIATVKLLNQGSWFVNTMLFGPSKNRVKSCVYGFLLAAFGLFLLSMAAIVLSTVDSWCSGGVLGFLFGDTKYANTGLLEKHWIFKALAICGAIGGTFALKMSQMDINPAHPDYSQKLNDYVWMQWAMGGGPIAIYIASLRLGSTNLLFYFAFPALITAILLDLMFLAKSIEKARKTLRRRGLLFSTSIVKMLPLLVCVNVGSCIGFSAGGAVSNHLGQGRTATKSEGWEERLIDGMIAQQGAQVASQEDSVIWRYDDFCTNTGSNMRTGPRKSNPVIYSLQKNSCVKVKDNHHGWLHVFHYNNGRFVEGYIWEKLLYECDCRY